MKGQKKYNRTIARFGCYFCVVLSFCEKLLERNFSDDEVESFFEGSQKIKSWDGKNYAMNENCYMNDPAKVGNLSLGNFNKKLVQIGTEKDGIKKFWGGWKEKDIVFVAEEWATKYGSHWICEGYNPDPSIELLRRTKKVFYGVYKK